MTENKWVTGVITPINGVMCHYFLGMYNLDLFFGVIFLRIRSHGIHHHLSPPFKGDYFWVTFSRHLIMQIQDKINLFNQP